MADTQELITDLRIRDNLTVGLAKAKAAANDFGNTAALQANRASTSLDKVGLSADKVGLSVKNLVGGFLAFSAVQGVVSFLKDAVQAAQEDEVSIARLTTALKENVAAWNGQTVAIEKAIGAGQRLGFADDEIRGSLTRLSAATHDVGQALQILNTAQDLARFRDISLAEATTALVTIEAGRFRGLAQLGIELKAGTTQTEALAAVQRVAGGQAAVYGKTQAGAAKEAQVAFDEAAESIGRGLLPILTETAHFSRDVLAPALQSVGDNMDKIVPAAGALALIVGGKLALGLASSVTSLLAAGVAAVQAADSANVLALAQEREALTANAAAVAQTELAAARAAAAGAGGFGATASSALAGAGAGRTAAAIAAGETLVGSAGGAAASGGLASFTAGLKAMVGQGLASVGMFNILHEAMVQDGTDTFAGVIAKKNLAQGLDALGRATTGLTPEIVAQSIAIGDSSRETLLSAKALAILASDTEQLKGSATSATPAEIALAKATIEASEAHRDLAEATKAATEAGPGNIAALAGMAEATSADELATAKLKATQDLLKVSMLGAENGTDTLSGSLVRGADAATIAASAYGLAADQIDRLKATGGKPFVAPPPIKIPGFEAGEALPTGDGMSLAEAYLRQQQIDRQNREDQKRRDDDAARERQRLKSEADAARDRTLSEAKAKAQERYNKTLQNTKDIATTLFDAQHARTLRAIKDTETLAQKQHDGALQQINDALKLKLETNAAPVTEAEQNQQRIELARQRRDLAEALAQARRGGDPGAIRSAQEAIQSFQAQQGINALRLEQAKKDAAAQEEARIAQKAADDQLAAAKIASAKDIEAENLRNKTQRARFDKELEALKRRDAGASPAKLKADIAKLEEKFGITTDAKGFHHIADVLETVAKDLKPTLTGIGDAAAGATPGLAAVGASATAAADGLAVFAKRLGEFAIVEPHLPRETTTPVIRDSDDDLLAAIKNLKLSPIIQSTVNVEIPEQAKPVDIDRLLAAISAQKEKAQPKDDLSPILKDIGDAAATATPRLAGLASESVTAADGLAIFARSLGDLKVLELPKPVAPPDIRQPVTALDQPRLSEAEILATAIKGITFEPTIMVQSTVNVTSPPIFLNGRLIAAALASSQSPAATPGIRTGTLSPRP